MIELGDCVVFIYNNLYNKFSFSYNIANFNINWEIHWLKTYKKLFLCLKHKTCLKRIFGRRENFSLQRLSRFPGNPGSGLRVWVYYQYNMSLKRPWGLEGNKQSKWRLVKSYLLCIFIFCVILLCLYDSLPV